MRVAIDIRPMLETRRSGVANYTARLLQALLALPPRPGRRYALFANAWGRPLPADLPAASATVENFFHHFPNRLLNASFAWRDRPLIEDLAGGADLVYLPNLNFVASRRPLIVTVHDLSFRRYPEFFSAKQRLWHAAVNPDGLLRRAAAVVAVSEHTRTDVIETFGLPPERVRVVPPGVGPEFRPRTEAEKALIKAKYGLPEEFYLYLGTLEPRKNVAGLIAAFEKIGGRTGLVIAGGKGWLYRRIFSRAAASPARDRIKFLDYVDEADKPALYAAALALVYPSFYEGFGLPPLEALAAGTPVIASHASSLGEVVGAAGLLVDPHDTAAIAEAMRTLRDEPATGRLLAARGPEQAKKFSWEAGARRLDALFAELGGE